MKYLKAYLGNSQLNEATAGPVREVLNRQAVFRYASDSVVCDQVEAKVKSMLQVPQALLMVNGTLALKAALLALTPTPGQIVLIPSISFIATANAVLSCGLIPLLVDVDEQGMLCAQALAAVMGTLAVPPFAVIAVHLEGRAANMSAIVPVCQRYGIPLIEDCAQGMGVTQAGRSVGCFGDFGCFSFQANKLISSGEGGMIIAAARSDAFARACMVVDHGASRTPDGFPDWQHSIGFGENGKFNELQAALLLHQLETMAAIVGVIRRRHTALSEYINDDAIDAPPAGSVPLSLWVRRDRLANGIHLPDFHYDWKGWDLAEHPIIKFKRSPYADGFPWSLDKTLPAPRLDRHDEMLKRRLCIPVPLDDVAYHEIVSALTS